MFEHTAVCSHYLNMTISRLHVSYLYVMNIDARLTYSDVCGVEIVNTPLCIKLTICVHVSDSCYTRPTATRPTHQLHHLQNVQPLDRPRHHPHLPQPPSFPHSILPLPPNMFHRRLHPPPPLHRRQDRFHTLIQSRQPNIPKTTRPRDQDHRSLCTPERHLSRSSQIPEHGNMRRSASLPPCAGIRDVHPASRYVISPTHGRKED